VGILFRAAKPDDLAEIARLAGELGYPTQPSELAPRLDRALAARDGACIVAEASPGRLVGWVEAGVHRSLLCDPEEVIHGLVVDASERGTGIGAELMRLVEDWGRERGLTCVRLHSRDSRHVGHGFYEHLGYAREKTQILFHRRLE